MSRGLKWGKGQLTNFLDEGMVIIKLVINKDILRKILPSDIKTDMVFFSTTLALCKVGDKKQS